MIMVTNTSSARTPTMLVSFARSIRSESRNRSGVCESGYRSCVASLRSRTTTDWPSAMISTGLGGSRSEERRVGEEWRAWGGACHLKKKKKGEMVRGREERVKRRKE